jgi:hypothetical protein
VTGEWTIDADLIYAGLCEPAPAMGARCGDLGQVTGVAIVASALVSGLLGGWAAAGLAAGIALAFGGVTLWVLALVSLRV